MVIEISYEKYKSFCAKLTCKDAFYFIETLFLTYPNDDNVYVVKCPANANIQNLYENLKKKDKLTYYTLSEFQLGLPTTTSGSDLDESKYKGKNIVVQMPKVL